MCMKYVNATVTCFKSVTIDNNKIISFNAPFKSIKSTVNDNVLIVDNFALVTQIDFLGTSNSSHRPENPLEQKQKLDFIIRLTKCDQLEQKRIGKDLDIFSVDLDDMYKKNQVDLACFGFLNYTRITNVTQLDLAGGIGKYVLKILIKPSHEINYTIQAMTKLTIN